MSKLKAIVAMLGTVFIPPNLLSRDEAKGLPRSRGKRRRTRIVAPPKTPADLFRALSVVVHHTGADGNFLCGKPVNAGGPHVSTAPGKTITCNDCQREITRIRGKAAQYVEA